MELARGACEEMKIPSDAASLVATGSSNVPVNTSVVSIGP